MYGLKIIDIPEKGFIENPHHGIDFDYYFMGKPAGNETSSLVDLLLHIDVYASNDQKFIRKEIYWLERNKVREHIKSRIQNFMHDLGIDKTLANGCLRDFEVENKKCQTWDDLAFKKNMV